MGRAFFLFVVIVLLLDSVLLCGYGEELESLSLIIRCKKHEEEALLKFKQSITHDPMNWLSSWGVGEDCCQWHGVTCDNLTHNVVKLNLRTLPVDNYVDDDEFTNLPDDRVSMVSSGISSALLELKFLTHLDLSGNDFGGPIPEFIGSMRHLRYLNLSSATSSDLIPPQLGNLTNLVHLDLHTSYTYYPSVSAGRTLGWASGLLKLKSLDMSYYNLSQADDALKVLTRLNSLSTLSLYGCGLTTSHLSEASISNTSNYFGSTLQHLDLGNNFFQGPFPSLLKNMVSLRSLSLRHTNVLSWSAPIIVKGDVLSGSVPVWLKAMSRLEVLDLKGNQLSYVEGGGILGILGNPCNFKHLDLSSNAISQGDILESFLSLSGCDSFKLEYLDLSYNVLKGRVPASFAKLSGLKYLDLSNNRLSGWIPDFIGHLTQIEHIDISFNSLQGTVSDIGNLAKLSYLNLNLNNFNLNLNSSFDWRPPFQLKAFEVGSCVINAAFPQWLRNQTQIEYLDLSYTGISGELPGWIWNSSNLRELRLAGNQLTGSLPRHRVYDGPSISVLMKLDISNNSLSGTIPNWLGLFEILEVMDLSSNMFSGEFFNGINVSLLMDLYVLDLSDNMFSGEVRFQNTDLEYILSSLQILSLRGNQFVGTIPSILSHFGSLSVLDFAHNGFTGQIPGCLGSIGFNYKPLFLFEDFVRDLEIKEIVKGNVEMSGFNMQFIIDLSSNQLSGTIPELLTNLTSLSALNLSYNHLTGHIPESIGNMKKIESLDLSNNHLSGTIPQSLSAISWLSKLNLSNNNLHGPIPTGSQLQTLDDPSIYAGNSGLYGCPLPKNCTPHDSPPTSTDSNPTAAGQGDDVETEDGQGDNKYAKLWLILAIMSGVATGFWGVIVTLMVKKNWRHAYFWYVEDLGDRIYVPIKVRINRFKRRFV